MRVSTAVGTTYFITVPRRARIVIPGIPHHVTQRGNDCQIVFHSERDWDLYLKILIRRTPNHMRILGYALMSNHVHLIAIPERAESLAKVLQAVHSEYASISNRSQGRSGHLWQGRFFSCPLSPAHLTTALRYVDLNPVRAGLASSATEWKWSSARAHSDPARRDALLDCHWAQWLGNWDYVEWRNLLLGHAQRENEEWDALRRSTMSGEPLGSADFIDQLEQEVGRCLRVPARGRPPRKGDRAL
jgi:putative transposase